MLTDDQRQVIEAEEQLRHEVRRRLDTENPPPPPPPAPEPKIGFGKRVFDFFNSSVGMWLLSSVVLTGGAALLQNIQHNHEIAQQNRQQLSTHRFEITHRLDQMEYGLRRAKTVGDAKTAMDNMFKSKYPLTPELQNRSLASLYLTVYPMLAGTEKEKTNKAYNLVKQLEEVELLLLPQPDETPLSDAQRNHINKLMVAIQQLKFEDGK